MQREDKPATPTWPAPPARLIHADWSLRAGKRRAARAVRAGSAWHLEPTTPVPDPAALLADHEGGLVLGLDVPLGAPAAWAAGAGVEGFASLLADELGQGRWADFWRVCEDASQIRPERPFYPHRPGGTRRAHLVEGLELSGPEALLRACDRPSASGARPCALFWTMGARQVGKAAITAWRDLLQPALAHDQVPLSLWPFHGTLEELMGPGRIVACEVYPAEIYGWLGLDWSQGGKRSRRARAAQADAILGALERAGAKLAPTLCAEIEDGFGEQADGEDRFDAVVGLTGMLQIVAGQRAVHEPTEEVIRSVEGWILGRGPAQPST